MSYPEPVKNLISAFSKLPSVGNRTAERFVFHLLKSGKKDVAELSMALSDLMKKIKSCPQCWDFSDKSPCDYCSDPKRDQTTLCVVSEPQGVQVIEKSGSYKGLYHILRGTVKAGDIESAKQLKISPLLSRVKQNQIKEIILALNPDIEGETTMMLLKKKIKKENPDIKITSPVRGLPMGADLHYADEITLSSAFKNRIEK